eukprot:TRINITY_DN6553_c0_g1_i1.p1 TRINITY_DN6553_c0_g1~~TRINITY_DN6553_c0_g1_i1.p1  ORF type:complete len:761 (-),score=199.31 TRINITY_DN6553_c0_g1_i1:538-2820(-)
MPVPMRTATSVAAGAGKRIFEGSDSRPSKRQCQGLGSKSELLNLLGEIKARLQDNYGVCGLPMPQFILIGKQSVGKSRLIEALAGETFNFISGSLGSRRPTVLEFRHLAEASSSIWHMRDRRTQEWKVLSAQQVMEEVGSAHEELGTSISSEPVYVRLESAQCVDMQIVDLPGFRNLAIDESRKVLSRKISELVDGFMRDKNNVMLCVEEAGDASNMSTLQMCREVDPKFERTILIRNKLDKYYTDLTADNSNQWMQGFNDLPADMMRPARFAVSLPYWDDGQVCPGSFLALRDEKAAADVELMKKRGLSVANQKFVGFNNLAAFLERRIETMFGEAVGPVMNTLLKMKVHMTKELQAMNIEYKDTDPKALVRTARECGASFATALAHVMEGVLGVQKGLTLEQELRDFHASLAKGGEKSAFEVSPSKSHPTLDEYLGYLRQDAKIPGVDSEVNGGAHFRRLLMEIETYLRFAEVDNLPTKRDILQARGSMMGSVTWRDAILKLFQTAAEPSLLRHVDYVTARLKWFFDRQKVFVVDFMASLEGKPTAMLYSPLYPKHARLMKQNETLRALVFTAYDSACGRQLEHFKEMFGNLLGCIMNNPWVFLRVPIGDAAADAPAKTAVVPSFEEIKGSVPGRVQGRLNQDAELCRWMESIPTESQRSEEAMSMVTSMIQSTFGLIRSELADQLELSIESLFRLQMLRRLEHDMSNVELVDESAQAYLEQHAALKEKIAKTSATVTEVGGCIARVQSFKLKQEMRL